jgi:hypothetical protein
MTFTRTHTHTVTEFADPYLRCNTCGNHVTGYITINEEKRCDHEGNLVPCGHPAGISSDCPSWSPVDGCHCLKHLGKVDHGPPRETKA